MINVKYDVEADAAYIRLSERPVQQTREESDVCIVDLDESGQVAAIELLSVFGFAGASLHELVRKGLISGESAWQALNELRSGLLAPA